MHLCITYYYYYFFISYHLKLISYMDFEEVVRFVFGFHDEYIFHREVC